MRMNISRNHSKSLNLPDLQKTVLNLRKCIVHDFDILANIAENGCTRKKPDIQYMCLYNKVLKEVIKKYIEFLLET